MSDEGAPPQSGTLGRRIVLILGMHRSGTSMLARLLAAEGLPLGAALLTRRSRDNRHGYWEQAEIVAIHEALLDGFDRTWHGPNGARPLPEHWLRAAETEAAKRRLIAIVGREMRAADGVWGFKDPRTLRFLPLWRAIVAELDVTPVFILAARAPAAVAASLMRRNRLSRGFAETLWAANTITVLRAAGPELAAVVDYDAWFTNPEATARHLRAVLRLPGPGLSPRQIEALIDPRLCHHDRQAARAEPAFEALHAALIGQAPHRPPIAELEKPLAAASRLLVDVPTTPTPAQDGKERPRG